MTGAKCAGRGEQGAAQQNGDMEKRGSFEHSTWMYQQFMEFVCLFPCFFVWLFPCLPVTMLQIELVLLP